MVFYKKLIELTMYKSCIKSYIINKQTLLILPNLKTINYDK